MVRFDKWAGFIEHSRMADRYQMDEELEIGAEALKAIADPIRSKILTLVQYDAASITQLAAALGRPKGSVGHHVKVLEEAGLLQVVRTRKVRAMTERFYGRTARWFLMSGFSEAGLATDFSLQEAITVGQAGTKGQDLFTTARYARIPADRAAELGEELLGVVERFLASEPEGETIYAMLAGIFPTTLPSLVTNDG